MEVLVISMSFLVNVHFGNLVMIKSPHPFFTVLLKVHLIVISKLTSMCKYNLLTIIALDKLNRK